MNVLELSFSTTKQKSVYYLFIARFNNKFKMTYFFMISYGRKKENKIFIHKRPKNMDCCSLITSLVVCLMTFFRGKNSYRIQSMLNSCLFSLSFLKFLFHIFKIKIFCDIALYTRTCRLLCYNLDCCCHVQV